MDKPLHKDARPSRVRNDTFNPRLGFDRGRSVFVFALWQLVKTFFFLTAIPWPSWLKTLILRAFGAKVGHNVYWKPRVNIHIPWKLEVGDYTWVGEEVCIINFAPVIIGAHCCLSQQSVICSGNHDYRHTDMRYRHEPIKLANGVWIGACTFVGPGVEIGTDAVVAACAMVSKSLEGGWVYAGKPCRRVRQRWAEDVDHAHHKRHSPRTAVAVTHADPAHPEQVHPEMGE